MSLRSLPARLVATLLLTAASLQAVAGTAEDERARNAVRVLNEMQVIPESAIPDKLLDEAHAIAVIPDTVKAGLIIGGRRGHGLLSVKNPDGTTTLIAKTVRQMMTHLERCLDEGEDELLIDQVISDKTKQAGSSRQSRSSANKSENS